MQRDSQFRNISSSHGTGNSSTNATTAQLQHHATGSRTALVGLSRAKQQQQQQQTRRLVGTTAQLPKATTPSAKNHIGRQSSLRGALQQHEYLHDEDLIAFLRPVHNDSLVFVDEVVEQQPLSSSTWVVSQMQQLRHHHGGGEESQLTNSAPPQPMLASSLTAGGWASNVSLTDPPRRATIGSAAINTTEGVRRAVTPQDVVPQRSVGHHQVRASSVMEVVNSRGGGGGGNESSGNVTNHNDDSLIGVRPGRLRSEVKRQRNSDDTPTTTSSMALQPQQHSHNTRGRAPSITNGTPRSFDMSTLAHNDRTIISASSAMTSDGKKTTTAMQNLLQRVSSATSSRASAPDGEGRAVSPILPTISPQEEPSPAQLSSSTRPSSGIASPFVMPHTDVPGASTRVRQRSSSPRSIEPPPAMKGGLGSKAQQTPYDVEAFSRDIRHGGGSAVEKGRLSPTDPPPARKAQRGERPLSRGVGEASMPSMPNKGDRSPAALPPLEPNSLSLPQSHTLLHETSESREDVGWSRIISAIGGSSHTAAAAVVGAGGGGTGVQRIDTRPLEDVRLAAESINPFLLKTISRSLAPISATEALRIAMGGGSSGQQHHHMLLQQQQQSYVSSSDHLQQQQQPHSASPATLMSSSASSTTTALNISGGVAPAVERPRASSITQVGVAKRARSPPSASDNVRHAQRRDDENAAAPATSSSPLALLEQQEHTVPSPRMSKNCTPTTTTSPGLAGAPLSADTSAPFQPYPLSHESSSSPVPQSSSSQPQSVAALTPEPTPTGAATQGLFERSNHVGGSVVGAMSVPSVNMKTLHAQQQQQQQHDTVASHSSVALLNVSNARSASLVSPGRKTSTGGGAATQHQPLRSPRLSVSTNPTQHLPSPRNSAIVEQILQLSARRESEAQHAALHPAALPADNPAYRTTRIVPLPNIAVTTGIPPAALKKMRERAYASCNRSASIDDHEADITAAFHRDLRRHGGNVPLAFTMDDDEGSSNHAAARLVLGRVLDHLYATTPTTSIVEQKQHHDSEQHHPLNTFDHPVTTVDEGGHIDDDPTMPTAAGPNAVARTNSVSINRTSTMPFFDRTGGAMPSGSLSALLEVDDDEENEQVNTTTTFMKPHSNVAKDIHVGDNEEDCITVGMKTRPSSAAAMLNDTSSILKTAVAVPTTNSKKPGLSVMIDHQDQQQVVAPSRQKQLLPTSSSSSTREELPPTQPPVHHATLTSSSAHDAAARNDASLFTIVFTEPSKACFSMDADDDDNNNNDVKRHHEDGEQYPFSFSPPSSLVPPPQHDEDAEDMFEAASKRRQSLPRLHIPGVSAASPPTEELMSLTASQNHNTHLRTIDSAAEAPRLVVDVTSGSATAAQAGQAALSSIRTPRKRTVNAATTSAVTRSPRRASLASPRATSAVTPTATVVASGGRTPRRASMGTSLLASSNNATPTTGGSTAAKSPRPGSGGKSSGVVSTSSKRGAQQRPATSDGSSLPPTTSGNAPPVNVATSFSSPPPISLTPPTGHDNIAESEQTPATTGPAAKVKPAKSPRAGSAGSSRTAAVATSVSPTPTTRVSSGKTRSGSVAKKGRRPSSADGTKPESREGSGSRGGDAEVDDDDEEDIRPDSEERSSSLAAAPHGGNSDYAAQSFDLLAFDTPQEVALRPAPRGGGGDDHHHPLLAGANVPNKPRPTPRGKQSSSSGGGGGVTPRASLGATKSSKTGGGGGVQRSKSPRVPADTQAAKAAKAQEDEERLDDGSAVKVQQISDSDADDDDDSAAGPLQTSRDPIATMLLAKQKSATMEDLDAKMKLRRSIIKRLAGILHKDLRTAAMHIVAKQQQQRKEGESPRGAGLSITSAAAAMMGSSGSTLPPDDNASVMSVGALSSVASPLMPLKSPLAGGASSLRGPASPYANSSSSNHNNNGGEREFRAPPKVRVAVVISISQYKDNKIPRNQQCEFEASAMASTLASMGFVVTRMSMLSNQEDLRPTSKEVVLKCIKAATKPCKIGADFASIVYVCGGGFIGPLTGANQGNNPQPVNLRHAPKPLTEHLPPAAGSTAFVVVPGDVTFSLLARDTVLTLSDLQSIPSCTDGTNSWVLMDTYSISFLPPCPPNLNGFAMVGGRKTIGGELFCLYEMQHLFPLSLYCLRAISGWATRDSRLSVNAINAYVHGHLTRRGLFATTTASPFFVGDLDLATVHELRFCRQQVKDIRNVLHGKYTTVSLTLIPTRNQDPTSAEFVRHLRTAFLELLASDATNPMVRCLHRVYEPKLFAIMRGINPAKFVADDAALFRHMQAASRDLRERLQDPSVEYRVQAFGSMLLGEITMTNAYSRDAFLLTLENSKRIRQVKELKKEWLVKVEEMRAKRKQLHEQQEAALKLQEEEASMKQLQQQQSPLLNATVGSALGMTQSSSEPNPSFASVAGGSIVDADSVASGSIRRTSTPTVPPTASTPTPITPRPGSQQQRGFARNPAAAPPTPTAAVVAPHTTTIMTTTNTASDDHHVPRVIMTSGNMFNINAAIQLASLQQAKPDVSRAAGYFSNPIDNGFTIDGKAVHELGLLCCTTFLTTEFLAMKLDRAIRSHGLLSHDFIVKDVRIVPMDEDHVQLHLLICEIQAQWRGRVTRRKMSVLLPTVRDEVARREKIIKEEHDFILKINATLVWSAQRITVDAERTARGDLVEMQHQALTYMYMDRVALYQRIAYHWYSTIVAKVAAQEAVFRGEIVSRKNIVWPGILRLLFWRKYIRILRDDDKGRKKIEEQAETKIRNVASQFWKVERKRW